MYHFGKRNYGVVDQVPGVLHVATEFLHFNFFPVWPMQSYAVPGPKAAAAASPAPLPRSWKSIGFAWLRAGMAVAGLAFLLNAPLEPGDLAWAGGCALTWWRSHGLSRAGPRRAAELAWAAGVPMDVALARFGASPPAEEAQALRGLRDEAFRAG